MEDHVVFIVEVGECDSVIEEEKEEEKREEVIEMKECRICQEEDTVQNLDIPCACTGTLKFAHKRCVQLWCSEKGDTLCEICLQPFKPGYSAKSRFYHPEDTTINIRLGREDWTTSSNNLYDPRFLAIAAVDRQVLEAEHDTYDHSSISGTAFFRFSALLLMTFVLLSHSTSFVSADVEKALACFPVFFLRVAALVLPCYILAQIFHMIRYRRQRQVAEFAISPPPRPSFH